MHDQQSITRMSGAEFVDLTDSLSVTERDDALSYLWGAHPAVLAAALNWAEHQRELRAARAAEDLVENTRPKRVTLRLSDHADGPGDDEPAQYSNPFDAGTYTSCGTEWDEGDWICTLPEGHAGQHQAWTKDGTLPFAVLDQSASVTA